MTLLDISTPRGQETLRQEERAALIIESNWYGCKYVHTPKDKIGAVDAFIIRNFSLYAVAETKCREMNLDTLRYRYRNEWLVTFEKILKGRQVSDLLRVDYWGFLYLAPEDIVMRVKIYSPENGGWLVPFRVEKTVTQKTVNGGEAERDNAFISMATADQLRMRL